MIHLRLPDCAGKKDYLFEEIELIGEVFNLPALDIDLIKVKEIINQNQVFNNAFCTIKRVDKTMLTRICRRAGKGRDGVRVKWEDYHDY